MPILYHSVDPESNRDTFSEYNTADFVINTDRNIVRNSIRLEGSIKFSRGAAQVLFTDRCHMNKRIGIHSIIESSQVMVGGSVVENINTEYARFAHMIQSATKSRDDYYDSGEICELKAVSTDVACAICQGESTISTTKLQADFPKGTDFSFKPIICVNRCDNDIPMGRLNNEMRLSFNLARAVNVLCGIGQSDPANLTSYTISDLRLTYRSADPVAIPSVGMRSVFPIKQVVSNPNASLNSRVPGVCNAVSISFLKKSKENAVVSDNVALEALPHLDEVGYTFNDATNQLVQYSQEEYSEYMEGYLESLGSAGVHSASPNNIKGNSVFGLGLKFGADVDLSTQKFGVNIRSGATSTLSYLMFQFFHSKISL